MYLGVLVIAEHLDNILFCHYISKIIFEYEYLAIFAGEYSKILISPPPPPPYNTSKSSCLYSIYRFVTAHLWHTAAEAEFGKLITSIIILSPLIMCEYYILYIQYIITILILIKYNYIIYYYSSIISNLTFQQKRGCLLSPRCQIPPTRHYVRVLLWRAGQASRSCYLTAVTSKAK